MIDPPFLPLDSFQRPATALVVGASGGIGSALLAQITAAGFASKGTARRATAGLSGLDITNETEIAALAASLRDDPTPLCLVIVATGLLHDATLRPEKSLRALETVSLTRSFAINTIGPALVAKHLLPILPRTGRCVFAVLSARVGSISDNRIGGWYGYRAAKAALNQIIRTLSIEIRRTKPEAILVALHPGTVATGLSAPFRGQVPSEGLFTPVQAAGHLLNVIDRLTPEDSGGFFAWDGTPIPF
jgi:NAD(P)-dependent dehydrogenase (short-subunit alcohol dehydrogenase family)